jgi:VWFA-related protein
MRVRSALVAALLFSGIAVAQPEEPKFKVRSNLVFLPTRVQYKNGETIYGLKPEQFVVEDNGIRQSIQVEEPDTTGLSLAVVVQCSLSAPAEFGKLKGLGTMIDAIVGDAPHEVSVVGYGETPYLLGDFTRESASVRRALSKLEPCGDYHAATIDAVRYAVKMLDRRPNHNRRAILLISEMRDHGSRAKLHEVVGELGISDTVIYSVAFSPVKSGILQSFRNSMKQPDDWAPPPRPKPVDDTDVKTPEFVDHQPLFALPPQILPIINALRENAASELASLSGGEYMSFSSQKNFDQDLLNIANQIHNYYLLSFQPSSGGATAMHSLRVRVPEYPDALIQTRKSYWSGL